MNDNLIISIVTPSYNSASTIKRCIDSIRAQSYKNIEHIVIDGGSTDGTVDILRDLNVMYYSEADAGIYHAMNKGIGLAKGEVIHILNSDDWYSDSEVVQKILKKMNSDMLDICHAKILQVDSFGRSLAVLGADVQTNVLKTSMKVAHPSCFVRSLVYHRYGLFSQGFKIAGDYDFVLRVWDKVRVGFISDIVVHMQTDGVSNSNPVRSYKDVLAVSLVHGRGVFSSVGGFFLGCFKHFLIVNIRKLLK